MTGFRALQVENHLKRLKEGNKSNEGRLSILRLTLW